jgi:hypothetical protein
VAVVGAAGGGGGKEGRANAPGEAGAVHHSYLIGRCKGQTVMPRVEQGGEMSPTQLRWPALAD